MTKIRQPDTLADAVHVIAATVGWANTAAAIGKSESLVRQFADPDADPKPNIDQALKLDAAYTARTGEPGPIGLYYAEQSFNPADLHKPAPIHQRLCDLGKQVGDVYAAAAEAMADGRLSARERERILRECGDVEAVIRKIKRDVKG